MCPVAQPASVPGTQHGAGGDRGYNAPASAHDTVSVLSGCSGTDALHTGSLWSTLAILGVSVSNETPLSAVSLPGDSKASAVLKFWSLKDRKMSAAASTDTIKVRKNTFTHRFAGPCRRDLQPYSRPDILAVLVTEDDGTIRNEPHCILWFGRSTTRDHCHFEVFSERDEGLYGYWYGTHAELLAILNLSEKTLSPTGWDYQFKLSGRAMRVLTTTLG